MKNIILLLMLLLASCKSCPDKVPPFTVQEFSGREELIAYGFPEDKTLQKLGD